jgi:myosin heavy subunit
VEEWEIQEDLIFKQLSHCLKITKAEFLAMIGGLSKKNDNSMQFERKYRNYRHIISNIVFIVFEKLIFEIVERVNAQFEPPSSGNWLALIEIPGYRNKEENGFDDLHINYLNERLFQYYIETLMSLEKVS